MKKRNIVTLLGVAVPIVFSSLVFAQSEEELIAFAAPATNDTASPWPIVIFVIAAVAILVALLLLKRKK